MKKTYIVTDLGPGDGGKGGVIHRIATRRKAHTIIKVGGAQGSHGVRTSDGRSFAFSQWGCGTLEGIKTFLSRRFTILPEGLLLECKDLQEQHGIEDPFELMTIDAECLVATHYHRIYSRIKELLLGDRPRGTIGSGVGVANRYAVKKPELIIRARDLHRQDLYGLLKKVREMLWAELQNEVSAGARWTSEDESLAEAELRLLLNDRFLEHNVRCFEEVARRATIVDAEYLPKQILARDGVVVVESSHGVLTDNVYGLTPHTSALRTLPSFAREMITGAGYDGEVVSIGVHRAYAIRHGAGPLPTHDPTMSETLLPGSHKLDNRWQGQVRVGPLDLPLLRYAIAASGGPNAYDGLAITWFDQIRMNGEWRVNDRYDAPRYHRHFHASGEPLFRNNLGSEHHQREYQIGLTEGLFQCVPQTETIPVAHDASNQELVNLCTSTLNDRLGVPVRMIGLGPTETDKIFI